jgi:hypothetical protein
MLYAAPEMKAALEKLLFWNEGIEKGIGNHHPHDHLKVIREALSVTRPTCSPGEK